MYREIPRRSARSELSDQGPRINNRSAVNQGIRDDPGVNHIDASHPSVRAAQTSVGIPRPSEADENFIDSGRVRH
jgi:hypothetical protein